MALAQPSTLTGVEGFEPTIVAVCAAAHGSPSVRHNSGNGRECTNGAFDSEDYTTSQTVPAGETMLKDRVSISPGSVRQSQSS